MLKISLLLWILLTALLISLPVGLLSFFLSKKIYKRLWHFLGKFDTMQNFKRFRYEVLNSYMHKFKNLAQYFSKEKIVVMRDQEQKLLHKIEDILKPSNASVQQPDSDLQILDEEEDRVNTLKKKKLVEKIIYDALALKKEWNHDEYEKKIIEWLAIDADDRELNKLLADSYFTVGNHKKALSILKRIVELDPEDHKAIWQIGEIYLNFGDFDIAELLIQKAISINPSNPKYYISMVELCYNTDRKQDAIWHMETVIKLRPSNATYMITLADLYEEVGDGVNAKKCFFRTLEFDPSNQKAKKKLQELTLE